MCIRLENKRSATFHLLVTTSILSGRLCRLSILLIALISLCLTTVPITKRAIKGQRAGMSNGSKSVNDGCLCQEEQSEKSNMRIKSCIAFSPLDDHLVFLILGFLD